MADNESSVDKLINIAEFLEKWQSVLTMEEICGIDSVKCQEYIALNTEIPPGILTELETVCGPDTLAVDAEPKDRDILLATAVKDTGLVSVGYQVQELERRKRSKSYRATIVDKRKYLPRKTPWVHHSLLKEKSSDANNIDGPEVILTVEIFRPFNKSKRMILDQEIHVLSSQCLVDLRDKISCLSDQQIPGEYSDQPNIQPDIKSKNMYKAGYFFIEDVFYNDMRDTNNQDNSKVISEWATKEKLGTYTSRTMESTKFLDLTVKLGHPYLYEHQGSCQHLIVISEIRLVHKDDCQDRNQYPLVTSERLHNRVLCRVCGLYTAKWLTKGSSIAPEDPCFYCNTCFQAFHYGLEGEKLFDFTAYQVYCDSK